MGLEITIRNATPKGATSLCDSCSLAHIQLGFSESERMVKCNYGWEGLNAVPFEVRACTNYNNRTLPDMDEMEKIAWKLEFRKSTTPVGFKNKPVFTKPDEEQD